MAKFNERLKSLRKDKGITQKELALEIEKPQSTITKWENGQLEPNIEIIEKLASFFNVTIDYLLGKSDKKDLVFLSLEEAKSLHPNVYTELQSWFEQPYSGTGLNLSKFKMEDAVLGIPLELSNKELKELQEFRKNSNKGKLESGNNLETTHSKSDKIDDNEKY